MVCQLIAFARYRLVSLALFVKYSSAAEVQDTVILDGVVTSTFGRDYTVVMRADIKIGTDQITWWLNPTNSGNDDAGLTASALASGSFSSFAFQSAADLQRLNYAARDWNGNVFFDEPRLATSVASLVPEPNSVASVEIALLGSAIFRKRIPPVAVGQA